MHILFVIDVHLENHRSVRLLAQITGTLVALLSAGAFALSFSALQQLASQHGVSVGLTWIWPLILDGAIVVFSLSVLRASLYRESATYPMTLTIIATGASLVFNMAHAPVDPIAKLMASIPPLALFASFELVIRQIRTEVQRGFCLATLGDLNAQVVTLGASREQLEVQIEQLKVRKEGLRAEIREAKVATAQDLLDKANEAKTARIEERMALVAELAGQGKTPQEIASAAGVSHKTVKRDLAKLRQAA